MSHNFTAPRRPITNENSALQTARDGYAAMASELEPLEAELRELALRFREVHMKHYHSALQAERRAIEHLLSEGQAWPFRVGALGPIHTYLPTLMGRAASPGHDGGGFPSAWPAEPTRRPAGGAS